MNTEQIAGRKKEKKKKKREKKRTTQGWVQLRVKDPNRSVVELPFKIPDFLGMLNHICIFSLVIFLPS